MLRRQMSPLTTAIAMLVILAVIQMVYWRLLVYREPGGGGGAMGGGAPPPIAPAALGREDVQVETLAGDVPGYRDGAGWEAQFSGPAALAVDRDGHLLVADSRNHRIRRIAPDGTVTTLAGGGQPGGPGGRADGAVHMAQFRFPAGVAAGPDGSVYVADTGNHRICRIRDGTVTTFCGGRRGRTDGARTAASFEAPAALYLDAAGALWVADAGRPRRVDPSGRVSTPASVPSDVRAALAAPRTAPEPLTASVDGNGPEDGTPFQVEYRAPAAAVKGAPLVIPDPVYSVIYTQSPGRAPFLIAGRRSGLDQPMGSLDAHGARATFALPAAAVSLPDGTAYVADYEGNRIRRLKLPPWMLQGGEAPARRAVPAWRRLRGS